MSDVHDRDRAVEYLLDEMPVDERDAFEDQFLDDENAFAEVLAAEDELIDSYSRGALSPERRARFERRYSRTVEAREIVEFGRTLQAFAATRRPGPAGQASHPSAQPAARWLPWAAVLVTGVIALALLARQEGETRRARAERDALQQQLATQEEHARAQDGRLAELGEQVSRARERAQALEELVGVSAEGALRSASLLLTSGLRREEATPAVLGLESGVEIVRLQLRLPGSPRASYHASLQTAEGRELWARDGLRPASVDGGTVLPFAVPAALLSPGHYIVTLAAGPSERRDAEYAFEVRRAR
jgi:hypothetical protein